MTMTETADPRFPVGKFRWEDGAGEAERAEWIAQIAAAPAQFRDALQGLSEEQLDTPYRDGGWTVRQLAHHIPDSHINAYVRLKLGLTEDNPVIKPYEEDAWARLDDTSSTPVDVSMTLLDALHQRWVNTLRGVPADAWSRTVRHPERGLMRLDQLLALYAWHGRHHVAHITALRERMGW